MGLAAGAVFHEPLITRTSRLEPATVVTGHTDRTAAVREQYPGVSVHFGLNDALATQYLNVVVIASPINPMPMIPEHDAWPGI